MPDRIVRFVISGDSKGAVRAMRETAAESEKTEKKVKHAGEESERAMGNVEKGARKAKSGIALLAGAAGLGGLAFGIKDAVEAGTQFQAQQAQLQNALKNTGQLNKRNLDELNEAAEKSSLAGGFKGADETGALAQFVRLTKDSEKAVKLNTEAVNFARGAHVSYATAVRAVSQVQTGNVGRLSKYLGTIRPVTKHVDALTAAQKKYYPEMVKQAKALDQQSTAQKANAALTAKFGGASTAYSKTAAGAIQNLDHAVEALAEKVGVVLLPYITKAAQYLASGFDVAMEKWPEFRKRIDAVVNSVKAAVTWAKKHKDITYAVGAAVGVVVVGLGALELVTIATSAAFAAFSKVLELVDALMDANPITLVVLAIAALTAGVVYCYFHFKTFRHVVDAVFKWLKTASKNVVDFFKRHWGTIGPILALPFKVLKHEVDLVIKAIKYVVDNAGKVAHVASGLLHNKLLRGAAGGLLHVPIPHFASGGVVGGSGNTDSIPAMLTPGEVVLRKSTVAALGGGSAVDSLNKMTAGTGISIASTPVTLMLDGRVLAEATVHHQLKMAARR